MSYYKVKNITLKDDGLHIKLASSNVSPTVYDTATVQFSAGDEAERRNALKNLCGDIISGNFHMMRGMLSVRTASLKKTDYDLQSLETRLHNLFAIVENRDEAEWLYHIKGISDKVNGTIAENFFIPLVETGSFNRDSVKESLKMFEKDLVSQIEQAKCELKENNEWRIHHCGRLDIFKGYDVGISDIDHKAYIFPCEDYDKNDLGLLHNADKAIVLTDKPKTYSYLANSEYWLTPEDTERLKSRLNDYQDMKDLYTAVREQADMKGYKDISEACDKACDRIDRFISLTVPKEDIDIEKDDLEIER